MNILKYLSLALEVAGAVENFIVLFSSTPAGGISGPAIANAAEPAISAIEAVFPAVNIPNQLITDVTNAAADAINTYFKKASSQTPA